MKLNIGFTGDIAFSEYTKNIRNEDKTIENKIFEILNKNDYNILNFESPITKSNITKKNALAHRSDPENLSFIKNKFKSPILSVANNHIMDFGIKGLKDTINNLSENEIPFIGAGLNQDTATDYIIIGEDVKVGILSFQYKNHIIAKENTPGVAQDKHLKIIKKKIKELKTKVNYIVLIYHGGEEFLNYPMPYTRKKYKHFLKLGVDIIIAHHPHTVQGYEKIGKKIIFYSLGNFIFDTDFQRAQKGTDEGMIVNISFSKNNYTYKVHFLKKDRDSNKLKIVPRNIHYRNIVKNYSQNWKKEAIIMYDIRRNKKKLKNIRNNYSINNLHITKVDNLKMMDFEELINENYINELKEEPKFNDRNIIVRIVNSKIKKIAKLKNINKETILKRFCLNYAKEYNKRKHKQ